MTESTEIREVVRKPGVVVFAAVLNFIAAFFGFLFAALSLAGIFFGNAMGLAEKINTRLSEYSVPSVDLSSGLVFFFAILFALGLAVGVGSLLVGRGLLKGRKWAWYAQVASSVIGLLGFPFWTLMNAVILVLFFRPLAREHFKV
ncbi:MAG: hypothetical protein HYT89_05270 [Candidatus Omnitrophica bacterium]|nr:hypothetical protein [Candidatus Omnitrophota bacterium]